jgi:hypothetical protein
VQTPAKGEVAVVATATATVATTTVATVATSLADDATELSTNDDVAQDVLQVDIVCTVDTKAKAKAAVSSRNARSSRLRLLRATCIVVVAIAATLLFAVQPPPQPPLLRASGARVAADISDVEKYQLRDASGVTIGGGLYDDACAYVAASTPSQATEGLDACGVAARRVFATTTNRTGGFATSLKVRMSDDLHLDANGKVRAGMSGFGTRATVL